MTDSTRPNALVTGASRGIGAAIARELAAAGCRVIVNYRSGAGGADTIVREIAASGGLATAIQADVSVRTEVDAMYDAIESAHGFVQHLVNNAGITRDGPLMLMADAEWDAVLDTNLRGAYLCCQRALRGMMHLGGGVITNIVSTSGILGQAGQCNYSAAKGGLIAMTKALAQEMGRYGIRVNAVSPGLIPTDMSSPLISREGTALLSRIPLGRLGTSQEVAALVRFLGSDGARYITRQVIAVDGGLT